MLFNFEDSEEESKIPDSLKEYFFKRCDISQKEYDDLIKLAKSLPVELLRNRLKLIADFFYRLKKDHDTHKIHNQFAYAKKIILSDSFFENQKKDHSIPTVKETEMYLDEVKVRRQENPGVDKKTFHKRVQDIKKMYGINVNKNGQEIPQKQNDAKIKEKIASVMKKLEDEEEVKKLENKVLKVYKGFVSCELEYRLFKTALINVYLYHDEKAFEELLFRLKEKKILSIKELTEIRQSVLNKR